MAHLMPSNLYFVVLAGQRNLTVHILLFNSTLNGLRRVVNWHDSIEDHTGFKFLRLLKTPSFLFPHSPIVFHYCSYFYTVEIIQRWSQGRCTSSQRTIFHSSRKCLFPCPAVSIYFSFCGLRGGVWEALRGEQRWGKEKHLHVGSSSRLWP